ncbi:hypothetical protein MPSEU_000844100 [Mayamaea pseudoterrestris]|nr:hypothetical protein MPSEU_000844100 [Mayamaea pseudoterrestris]
MRLHAYIILFNSWVVHATTCRRNLKLSPTFAARSLTKHRTAYNSGRHAVKIKQTASIHAVSRIRGGGEGNVDKVIEGSYGWLMNLGAPAALVAGAVIGSLYEFNRNDDLELERKDGKLVTAAKKFSKLLLVFAFALELLCIFVITVMGTVLISKTVSEKLAMTITPETTPISFLRDNFEFEYLTARVTFLVGLLNWLTAIALHFIIPNGIETVATRNMDKLISSILVTLIILMVSFYNTHVVVYENIGEMILRYKFLAVQNYLTVWPPRPLSLALYPCVGSILFYMYQCFFAKAQGTNFT